MDPNVKYWSYLQEAGVRELMASFMFDLQHQDVIVRDPSAKRPVRTVSRIRISKVRISRMTPIQNVHRQTLVRSSGNQVLVIN